MITITTQNDKQLQKFLLELTTLPEKRTRRLVRKVAAMSRDETRRKIVAGNYAGPSKWIKAKKNARKALAGIQNRVAYRMRSNNWAIVDTDDPRYTLGQHQRGYIKVADKKWHSLNLKNPGALDPPISNPFIFKWKKNAVVPARDIIPHEGILIPQTQIIAGLWMAEIVKEAARKSGLQIGLP